MEKIDKKIIKFKNSLEYILENDKLVLINKRQRLKIKLIIELLNDYPMINREELKKQFNPYEIIKAIRICSKIFNIKGSYRNKWILVDEEKLIFKKLNSHNPADYHDWIDIGMLLHLHHQGSNEGLTTWCKWSSQCEEKYSRTVCELKWNSFTGHKDED